MAAPRADRAHLPVPERHPNGYKQYGGSHLGRLLRIKSLVRLGFVERPRRARLDTSELSGEPQVRVFTRRKSSTSVTTSSGYWACG